jgi:hypothetical protein
MVSLKDARFRHLSYVPEWRNDWIAGTAADRDFTVDLRS